MQYFDNGETSTQSETSKSKSVYAYEDPFMRPSSIIEYCAFAKNLGCSIEKDRVYGMLGIAYDALDIEADYNLMPEELWETLAVKTLLPNDLTVLHYANQSAGGASRVRSFAADFGRPMVDSVRLGGYSYPRYHAATQIVPQVELEEDGSVRIHVIKVDTVNQVNIICLNQDSAESSSPAKADALGLSAKPDLVPVDQDIIHQLYEWWKFWLAAKGPRYYDATDGKWAFPRTLIADNALPTTKEAFGHWTLKQMDILFAIFLLAKPHVDSTGQTTTLIDTWRVYELLGRSVRLELRLFPDDEECTTYYFPLSGAGPAQDEQLLVLLKMYDHPLYHRPDFSDTYARMQEEMSFNTSEQTQVIEITSPLKEVLELYATAISSILSHRHLFFTNVRLLGLGPRGMKAGDVVIVPEGSQTPFVYRREVDADDPLEGGCVRRGQLIGECYVHGLMNGDPVRKLTSDYDESHLELILT
ncbi:hypothetical protein BKA63DRAFT_571886 [Paraphoma chrysanthemicola]|nr:hypothetical protein BKA63DRAFT_571886 [Paraphoma chrysanthemicola]